MGIYSIKPKFQKRLEPLQNWLARRKINPTIINIFGFVSSLIAGLILYISFINTWFLFAIPPLVLLRIVANALDGLVSRKLGMASPFGEVMNEFFDRLSDVVIFLGLAFAPFCHLGLGVITIITILLSSYLGILSKASGGSRQYIGFMGKADRMLYLGFTSICVIFTHNLGLWNYFLGFILGGTLITVLQRFVKIRRELDA